MIKETWIRKPRAEGVLKKVLNDQMVDDESCSHLAEFLAMICLIILDSWGLIRSHLDLSLSLMESDGVDLDFSGVSGFNNGLSLTDSLSKLFTFLVARCRILSKNVLLPGTVANILKLAGFLTHSL